MVNRRQVVAASMGLLVLGAVPARSAIEDDVLDLLARHKVAGASLAVVEEGRLVWAAQYGLRWLDGPPVSEETQFQAASLSKTANALAVLAMVRDGDFGLDDPVNDLLRGWKLPGPNADEVTVAHLLSHTGATSVSGFAGYWPDEPQPDLQQILNGTQPANSAAIVNIGRPGRAFAYSGGGITVLQKLVEDVSGKAYDRVVENLVFRPLGMGRSLIRRLQGADMNNLAGGHWGDGSYVGYHNYPELAAAGLWTTPSDLAKALIAIMAAYGGDQGAFLPHDLARRMLTPVRDGAGLGTFIDGHRFTHTGVNFGFRAIYVGNLRSRSGYVIMSNGENGEALNSDLAGVIRRERGW